MILKNYWDQGLGRRLLEIILNHACQVGITRIEASVRTVNERAVRMYQQAGFVIEGTRKHAALIDGIFYDEYYIARTA